MQQVGPPRRQQRRPRQKYSRMDGIAFGVRGSNSDNDNWNTEVNARVMTIKKFEGNQDRLKDDFVRLEDHQRTYSIVPECSLRKSVQEYKTDELKDSFQSYPLQAQKFIFKRSDREVSLDPRAREDCMRWANFFRHDMSNANTPTLWISKGEFRCIGSSVAAEIIRRKQEKLPFQHLTLNDHELVNNSVPQILYFARSNPDSNIQSILDKPGPLMKVKNTAFDVAYHGASFGIRFLHGKKPRYIETIDDRTTVFYVGRRKDYREMFAPLNETLFEVRESTFLERKTHERDHHRRLPGATKVVTFPHSHAKKRAMQMFPNEFIDSELIVDGSMDYSKLFESIELEFKYQPLDRLYDNKGFVEVHDPNMVAFATKVLGAHVRVGKEETIEGMDKTEPTIIVIRDVPPDINNDERFRWFINKIFKANNLECKNAWLGRVDMRKDVQRSGRKVETNPYRRVVSVFLRACQRHNLLNVPGDLVCFNWPNVDAYMKRHKPFDVIEKKDDNGVTVILIKFKHSNMEKAKEAVKIIVGNVNQDFQIANSAFAPEIVGRYRKMQPMSRATRHSLDRHIRKHDTTMRNTFQMYGEMEDIADMPNSEAIIKQLPFAHLKMVEDWEAGSEFGLVGVEGFLPDHVDLYYQKFVDIIAPKVLECKDRPDLATLFYGVGESFIRHLEVSKGVEIDVDKYNKVLTIVGVNLDEVVLELTRFARNEATYLIDINVPLFSPYANYMFREFLKPHHLANLAKVLGAEIFFIKHRMYIKFIGSVPAYRIFRDALNHMDSYEFDRCAPLISCDIVQQCCPICMSPTDGENFYRLDVCGHSYCRDCINGHINYCIEQGFQFNCSVSKCNTPIAPADLKYIILGPERRMKTLDSQKLEPLVNQAIRYICLNSHETLGQCPTRDCHGILRKSMTGSLVVAKTCDMCNYEYCRSCLLEYHPDVTCEQQHHLRNDAVDSFAAYRRNLEGNFGICPKPSCNAPIEKELGGCNHMQCASCKSHFCWECGFIGPSSGAIYSHMQEKHGGNGGGWVIENDQVVQAPNGEFVAWNLEDPRQPPQMVLPDDFFDREPLFVQPHFQNDNDDAWQVDFNMQHLILDGFNHM